MNDTPAASEGDKHGLPVQKLSTPCAGPKLLPLMVMLVVPADSMMDGLTLVMTGAGAGAEVGGSCTWQRPLWQLQTPDVCWVEEVAKVGAAVRLSVDESAYS